MADFCDVCAVKRLGAPADHLRDFEGACSPDEVALVLCEGCGPVHVDHKGNQINPPGSASIEATTGRIEVITTGRVF